MRCSQLVDGAAAMSWSEYRKKKRQMLYKVLFSSASQLERCEFAAERSPAASPDCRSTSSHSRGNYFINNSPSLYSIPLTNCD